MARPEKIRLGDLLVQQKLVSQEQLGEALEKQRQSGRKLGRVLVEHGYVTEDEISGAIARQLNIPFLDLRQVHVRPEIVRLLPEQLARRFRAIVLEQRENRVLVAMADPTDLFAFDEIINHLNREVELAVANEGALIQFIDRVYRRTEEISELARNLTDELGDEVSFRRTDLALRKIRERERDQVTEPAARAAMRHPREGYSNPPPAQLH
jgi:MSHA biogenesis protein MshE